MLRIVLCNNQSLLITSKRALGDCMDEPLNNPGFLNYKQ